MATVKLEFTLDTGETSLSHIGRMLLFARHIEDASPSDQHAADEILRLYSTEGTSALQQRVAVYATITESKATIVT